MTSTPGGDPRRFAIILPRYAIYMRLPGGEPVFVRCDEYLHVAIGMAKRMNGDADYWEVIDCRTDNIVASSESERKKGKGRGMS